LSVQKYPELLHINYYLISASIIGESFVSLKGLGQNYKLGPRLSRLEDKASVGIEEEKEEKDCLTSLYSLAEINNGNSLD